MFDQRPLFTLPDGIETRWSSPENPRGLKGVGGKAEDGRKGSPYVELRAGAQQVLAEVDDSSGTVRRIWITVSDRSPAMLRSLRIDVWWDGAEIPAISAPLGDFFGTGLGRVVPFQSTLFASPEGRSFLCLAPMPFRRGMRIVMTNESGRDLSHLYYDVDYTLGDRHGDDVGYLHAHWRRERMTTLRRDYEFLPLVSGRGRFLGVNVGVIADRGRYFDSWWGEGECKVYLDGDRDWPTLCGTGTEDYIGTAWEQGRFDHLDSGCHVADHAAMRFCFYRHHLVDPVYFQRDIRVTMQQMGNFGAETRAKLLAAGGAHRMGDARGTPLAASAATSGLLEREDDWSSCAYVYLDRTENGLPPLAPVAERIAGL
ncbi:MAG: DUF2961 domain-containing protein [Planctomycetes bacterium]|nr:DUF2961 domain-containing protein [Planctomycetota bacterium]